jgi:hypothetical protein
MEKIMSNMGFVEKLQEKGDNLERMKSQLPNPKQNSNYGRNFKFPNRTTSDVVLEIWELEIWGFVSDLGVGISSRR